MITDSQCICKHCERGIHRLSKRSWHRQHTGYRVRALCSSDLVRWFLDRRQNGPCRFGARLRPAECAGRGTDSWQRGLRGTRARETHLRIGTICSIVVQFHSSSFSAMCRCSQKQEAWDWSQEICEQPVRSIIRIPKALTKVISPAVWK